MNSTISAALEQDDTIDITTIGRKTNQPRRIEIWFRHINGRTYITGTPGPRDWYANLLANPRFTFHLKQSVKADLAAEARVVVDSAERQTILSHPSMTWYHQQVTSTNNFIDNAPLIEVQLEQIHPRPKNPINPR